MDDDLFPFLDDWNGMSTLSIKQTNCLRVVDGAAVCRLDSSQLTGLL